VRMLLQRLFGSGVDAAIVSIVTAIVATLAMGPHLVAVDLDGVILLAGGATLLVASRVVAARGALGVLRTIAEVGACGAMLVASAAALAAHVGAVQLGELVRVQGAAPWEWAAARHPLGALLAFVYFAAIVGVVRVRSPGPVRPPSGIAKRINLARLTERLGVLFASALGAALFFGGWLLPIATEARSTPLLLLCGFVFVLKTWLLSAVLLGVAGLATPFRTADVRTFTAKRLVPALLVAGVLGFLARRLPDSASFETACGGAVVALAILVLMRSAVRVRAALARPEPHASPFL
jgi:hypothetical protein